MLMILPRKLFATGVIVTAMAVQSCAGAEHPTEQQTLEAAPLVRDFNALFQTDSLSYRLRAGAIGYEVEIGLVFTNRSPATAYVANCIGGTNLQIEKLVAEKWVVYWETEMLACVSPPILVQPFQRWPITIRVFGGYADCNCGPRFASDDLAGVYRVVFRDVYSSFNAATGAYSSPLTFSMRISNPFTLVPQQR
jgi:hypothetical protein